MIDPAFFEEMSTLLNEVIRERKANAISYEEYLKKIAELAGQVMDGKKDTTPVTLRTPALRALYNNLGADEELALKVHESIILYKPNGWRGIDTREKVVKKAIYDILGNVEDTERIFEIVKKQAEY